MAALVQIAVGAGIGGGQMLAGLIGPATNWRMPFVVMAAPSLLLAGVLWATGREPPRGGFEAALADQLASGEAYSEAISWAKVRQLLRLPSNCIIILQGLPGCLPWGVMQTYINDYLHLSKGFSIEMATLVILLFGIGCGAGVIAGGAAGQALYNWRKESMPLLTGLSVLAGAAPVLYLVNADLQAAGLGVSLLMAALAGFLVSIAGPNLRAIMINVNVPETRGVALALQSVTDDLGRGLGPVIVAGFISRLGRQGAFNLAVAGWVPCGLLLLGLVGTMRRDEALQQARLASSKAPGRGSGALREVRVQAPASPPSLASSLGGCEPGPDPAGLGPSGSRHALLSHTQPRSSSSSSNRAALPQPALPGELPSSALGEGGAASCSERQLLLLGEAGGGGSSGGAASGQGGCSGRGAQPGSAGSRGRWLAALLPRQQQQQQHGQQERCSDPGGLAHGGAPQCCQQQAGGRPERGLCSSSGGACACALTEARQRACRSSSAGRGGGEDGGSGSKAGGPVGECCEGGERSSLLPAPPRLGGSSSSLGSSSVRRCQSDGAACVA